MASIKTINFLPEVFRTDNNQKFLNATLDQLYTPPDLRSVNGYVGRKFAPTYQAGDNYQPEPSAQRQNYQLEPSVVVKNPVTKEVEFFSSYPDLLNQLNYNGALTDNQSRLFSAETYSYDGLFDFDKFVNFNQYYWLTNGPDTVEVYGTAVAQSDTYTVIRDANTGTYRFTGFGAASNPTVRLGRGGVYKFIVDQPGYPFWIQSSPGTSGLKTNQSNLSSRNVLGVVNNGIDVGTITFSVPQTTGQDYYITMPVVSTVDVSTSLHYNQIQGATIAQLQVLGGLDGITGNLVGKTFIFTNSDIDDSFWTVNSTTVPTAQRRSVWQIQLVGSAINLTPILTVTTNQRVYVTSGQTYAEYSFYIDPNFKYYFTVPDLTAPLDILYYQDGVGSTLVGEFGLVELDNTVVAVDTDIVGKMAYTSHNGVAFTNGLKVQFDASAVPTTYAGNTYYVEGVGTGIRLLPVTNFQTPESYLKGAGPVIPDYITINRASQDLNPWTRSNRWFHIDVIKAAAVYNNTVPVFDQNLRASRAIIEFEADLQLYNFGREAKVPVDIFANDGSITDARNQVELQTYKSIMGVALQNGQRIIFADDFDLTVRNQIFVVSISSINSAPVITLQPATDNAVATYNNLIVLSGTNAGIEYWFNGDVWKQGQQKTSLNQTPMFDVIDNNGVSLGDTLVYPRSTFATTKNNQGTVTGGTAVFSYDVGTGTPDQVLGFPLNYRTFTLSGDIQFVNNFDSDTFSYTENSATVSANINTLGTLQQTTGLTTYDLRNVWTTVVEPSHQYQTISGVYDGVNPYFKIDILPSTPASIPYIKVSKNFHDLTFITDYTIIQQGINFYVKITNSSLATNDQIDILIYNPTAVSALGYYQVPENLDFNSKNANFTTLTLGQLRNHLVALVSNSNRIVGSALGDTIIRDVSLKAQGGNILQNASPVLYSELFLVDSDANFFKGLNLARHNYGRVKNKILESSANLKSINTNDIPGVLDSILQTINSVKNNTFPWYYSDMVPYGPLKNTITYTVINPELVDYEISSVFSDSTLSNRAVLVYINNHQLTKGIDYVFDTTRAGITFLNALNYGDIITINDYSNTDGNYIPETPTKLGLYPKFTPKIYTDYSYVTPTRVIQGHDGSITPAFGDYRDDVLLEFELRIYNNIKVNYDTQVDDIYNFQPGAFRSTDYTNTEFTQLLTRSFLQWVGDNRVDFTSNSYFIATDPFTWNYSRFKDTVTGALLPGTWRAIFDYFYDTDRPGTAPWEMLGFSEQPSWWTTRYGPAPYTGGNMVMWQDLAAGYIWNNGAPYTDSRFARPGLLNIIPVDENGNLRPPTQYIVRNFNSNQANGSYAVGQQGPVETAWRRSSDFPYAMQQAIAMANPAYFFGSLMDVTRYNKNAQLNQYVLTDTLQRITPMSVRINGESNGTGGYYRVAGYLNWIADYLTSNGINPVTKIGGYLESVDVQLAYKMAGFSDTSFLQVQAEQASPSSTTNSVIIPPENYTFELYKSTPTQSIVYSAVVVERSENGYTVSGYDNTNPYFTIIPSLANNNSYAVRVGEDVGIVYRDYQRYKITVPYGFEFTNKQQLVDFLVSYQRYLTGSGIAFSDYDSTMNVQRDFVLSVQEFLSWSQQGWVAGSVLVLSPILDHLIITTTSGVVDQILNSPNDTRVLDTDYNFIKYNNMTVTRTDNRFTLTATSGQTIALAVLDVVEYEHVLIFDNITEFSDVIYVPELGNRQYRLKLVGKKTGSWTGAFNPPGFVYNSPKIDQWQAGRDYALGSLVQYKSNYYTATENLSASSLFYSNSWQKLQRNQIQTGLLPNFSYNAGKSLRYNDLNNPELQGDFGRFVGAEIGFRPRQYLSNFGIDIPTQAKFYQGFIRQKGTLNSVTAFTAAGFNGVAGNISLYEEWALRVGEYGALPNNQYVELPLIEGKYNGDPVTFTLLSNNEANTDSTISVYPANLYLTSGNLSTFSPTIYTNRNDSSVYENDINTAGYVRPIDTDIQIFDIIKYNDLTNQINSIGSGTKIWAAKDNITTSWMVYRVSYTGASVTQVAFNVGVTATVTTDNTHGRAYGDYVVIKDFDSRVDGVYQVYSIVDTFSFTVIVPTVAGVTSIAAAGTITGKGPLFNLLPVRLKTATDVNAITPTNGWIDGDKFWVDYDQNTDGWVVYNKSSPWTTANAALVDTPVSMQLDANSYISNSGFGTVSTINQTATFSAASLTNLGMGNVIAFVSNVSNGYNFTMVANLGARAANSVSLFGASLHSAGNLLYIGNPGNGTTEWGRVHIHQFNGNASFPWTQTLAGPFAGNTGDQFGYSISASDDGTWLYVGAPNQGNVYNYHANANSYYSYAKTINGNSYVTSGNAWATKFGSVVDSSTDGAQVLISSPYEAASGVTNSGAVYLFNRSRENFVASSNTIYFTQYPIISNTIKVTVNGNVLTSGYTSNSSAVTFTAAPIIGTTITVDTNHIDLLEQIISPSPTSGALFGQVAHIAGNDADVYVASPGYTAPGYLSGIVYRFVNSGANYGTITSTIIDPVVTVGDTLFINGILVTFGANVVASGVGNLQSIAANINSANIAGVTATAQDYGLLTINSAVTVPYQKLLIQPGRVGNAIANIGLTVYSSVQSITHPGDSQVANFGSQITSSIDSSTLVVAASQGSTYNEIMFDQNTTYFDTNSTMFYDISQGSGIVYIYGLVETALSGTAQDQYVLVQRLQNNAVVSNDQLGSSLSLAANVLLVGAPGDSNHTQLDAVSQALTSTPNAGTYYTYRNFSGNVGWDVISSETPKVDIDSITRMYIYNNTDSTLLTNFDWIDPAKGKVLGAAQGDIDYTTAYDPAIYNAGSGIDTGPTGFYNPDAPWGAAQVTKIWWDISQVRYLDYEQGNITYRSQNWGATFPGSNIQVAEWVTSNQLPSKYTGSGQALFPDDTAYVAETYANTVTGVLKTRYYFWVVNKTTVEVNSLHMNSAMAIQDIIENPTAQSIPYAAILRDDTISLYNVADYLIGSGNTVIFHADYDSVKNNNIIHSEYQLIQEGDSESLIPTRIVNKIVDSLSGIDSIGNPVPATDLSVQASIGLGISPNQTVFENRLTALENFVQYVNGVLIQYPIVEEYNINNLYTADPVPTIENYDISIDTHIELSYIDTASLKSGYTVLVLNDETKNGLWTTYAWSGTVWVFKYVQSYYTPFYWSFANWYASGYDSTNKVDYLVNTYADLASLTPSINNIAQVANRGNGQYSVYQWSGSVWNLVGIEDGTIQFNSNLYTTTVAGNEIRILFETLQNNIFINELAVYFNELFFFLLNYILTEQKAVDWAFKTSFVSILHKLKKLSQFPAYIQDNQTYYEDYINEVKPYRTSIREYKIDYQGNDEYYGDMTDFDIPATYISNVNAYRSPNDSGSVTSDAYNLANLPQYTEWYNNHSYSIQAVTVGNHGANYFLPPTVTVTGGGGSGANIQAIVNFTTNTIIRFDVVSGGSGYTSTPTININGTGTGATGYPLLVGKTSIESVPLQVVTLTGNVTVYPGNIVTQPVADASGTVYSASSGNTITLSGVVGTFTSNSYVFSDAANLRVRVGVSTESIVVGSNVTVYTGNIITQANTAGNIIAQAEVYSSSTGKTLSLWNATGIFVGNAYLFIANTANLSVLPQSYTVSSTATPIYSYTTFVDQSYNKVRTFDDIIKFDRVSYSSNITTWQPDTTITANSWVAYGGSAYQAATTVYSSAALKVNGNISANIGDYVTQANNSSANARIISISSNLSLVTVANLTTNYIRRGGNLKINGTDSNTAPVVITNIFDYSKYTPIPTANLGTAADRITAAYQPTGSMPGLNLAQLMSGIEYPGVQVKGVKYNAIGSNISSNAVYFYNNVGTLYSSNIAKIDFTTFGLSSGLPISVINHDASTVSNVLILNFTNTTMKITGPMANIALGANISIEYYDYNNPAFLDTNMQSLYTDTALGTRPEDVNVDGGAYYDTYSSHAPEELVPGVTFDNLNMIVYTNVVVGSSRTNVGYRVVNNMNTNAASTNYSLWPNYYAIFAANTSTLTANLNLTDGNIHVANAGAFAIPDTLYTNHPGIIFINGEKITYWTVDRVNNVLGQIRRAVDGTGAANVHVTGSSVVEASVNQLLPTSANLYANVHTSSWLNPNVQTTEIRDLTDNMGDDIVANVAYTLGGNIIVLPQFAQEFLTLTSNVTVSPGNVITQPSTGATGIVSANIIMTQANSGSLIGNTISIWAANVTGIFQTTATTANAWIYNSSANTAAQLSKISYSVLDGTGLEGSTTTQAQFIKGSG